MSSSLSNRTLRLSFNGFSVGVAAASLVAIISAFAVKSSSSCPAELDRISIIAGFFTAAVLVASMALIVCGPKHSSSDDNHQARWSAGLRGFALGVVVLDLVAIVAAVAMRGACPSDMDGIATVVLLLLVGLIAAGRGSSTAAKEVA
ncbi:hypothetical protein DFJ73DRAFT_841773 [Zopfochytrium polystomum]|nr:hypothetical protein DFJ73DRAFT_841773 [Zopfochytrium polystomum]